MDVNTTYEPFSQEPEYIKANQDFVAGIPLEGVRRILDLACGTGLLTRLLLDRESELFVTAIDLDPQQIALARSSLLAHGDRLLSPTRHSAADAAVPDRHGVELRVGSAMDLDDIPSESVDLVTIGNAIHLMPDRDRFLEEVLRVLRPGGLIAFNSVFFVGTYSPEAETLFAEWMKDAVLHLNSINEQRKAEGLPSVARVRGKSGVAFDKGWLTPEKWTEVLVGHGFTATRIELREVRISRQGLAAVGAYGGLAEVLMSGYPVEIASECLQAAAHSMFDRLGISHVPRFWLEILARKRED
jgi:ubiquinone/menaquinone biosynthesis C-methylase UbiE